MAGIYLHIPFCKQACHYCNFHFSTSLKMKAPLVEAILKEIDLQADFLQGEQIETIYFGGGTPSLLSANELSQIMAKLRAIHTIDSDPEITLEANPDDINPENLALWKDQGINRLSIGIQSFHQADLEFMNRAHNADEALNCVNLARQAGFDLLTIDLIYGSPTTSDAAWAENLEIFKSLDLDHISCYALTVEPNTALDHFIKKGKSPLVEEEKAARQFEYLVSQLTAWGYEQYEISNFSLPGKYARHNTSYWFGKPYMGIGPAAHSHKPGLRQWNIANNAKYIKSIEGGEVPFEQEILSPDEQYNEYVLTRLRTQWGCNRLDIQKLGAAYLKHFEAEAAILIKSGHLLQQGDNYMLAPEARFLADGLAVELFY